MRDLNYYLNLRYPFVLQQCDDGTYFIKYPDLKGCISVGGTIDEAIEMGKDALKLWLETALEDGSIIPEPKNLDDYPQSYKLRLPKSLYRDIALKAEEEGTSINQYCLYLLSRGIGSELQK